MARRIRCPNCGADGTIAPTDQKVFQGRGRDGTTPIVKCMECGCGLAFGIFSGTFIGSPKVIPSDVWTRMEEIWRKAVAERFPEERE